MALVGTLRGHGQAIIGDRRYNATYDISVSRTAHFKSGAGVVELDSLSDTMELFEAGGFTLELRGGETVKLIGKRVSLPNTSMEVLSSGPIPGF